MIVRFRLEFCLYQEFCNFCVSWCFAFIFFLVNTFCHDVFGNSSVGYEFCIFRFMMLLLVCYFCFNSVYILVTVL